MKNVRILALAAALSAVMTGSAFAVPAPHAGETLNIATTIQSGKVTHPVVVPQVVTITDGFLKQNEVVATITGLPADSWLVDAANSGGTTNTIKFKNIDGQPSHVFEAKAEGGTSNTVISVNKEASVGAESGLQANETVNVKVNDNVNGVVSGVYVSNPVVYTWGE
ncbi:TPA: hypothetical protein ACIVRG_004412 [Salmonella enterica subsp. enterica serovar Muenchen]